MLLRSSRFYLFGDQHYYGHIRLPQLCEKSHIVRVSHVHALPYVARNIILLRVSIGLHTVISSTDITGFTNSGSLTDTISVTKPN